MQDRLLAWSLSHLQVLKDGGPDVRQLGEVTDPRATALALDPWQPWWVTLKRITLLRPHPQQVAFAELGLTPRQGTELLFWLEEEVVAGWQSQQEAPLLDTSLASVGPFYEAWLQARQPLLWETVPEQLQILLAVLHLGLEGAAALADVMTETWLNEVKARSFPFWADTDMHGFPDHVAVGPLRHDVTSWLARTLGGRSSAEFRTKTQRSPLFDVPQSWGWR